MPKNCLYNINGICEIYSDEFTKQPCIESPCGHYKDIQEITSICPLCELYNSLGCPYGYIENMQDCDEYRPKRG